MKRRTRIDLVDQREYAYHGCLAEEAIIGSDYLINVHAWANVVDSASTDNLNDTLDYVALRRIVRRGSSSDACRTAARTVASTS